MSGNSSPSLLLVNSFGGADFKRHKCSEFCGVEFCRGDRPSCGRSTESTGLRSLSSCGSHLEGKWLWLGHAGTCERLVWSAPMMPSNNPMPLQWSQLGSACILWWEPVPRPLCSSYWFSNTANQCGALKFWSPHRGGTHGLRLQQGIASIAARARCQGVVCEVHRSSIMPSLDS